MSPAVDAALAKVRAAEKRLKAREVRRCPRCLRRARNRHMSAKEAAFTAYVKQLPGATP